MSDVFEAAMVDKTEHLQVVVLALSAAVLRSLSKYAVCWMLCGDRLRALSTLVGLLKFLHVGE